MFKNNLSPRRGVRTAIKTFLVSLLSAEFIFYLFILRQGGFGFTDAVAFTFWTILFSVLLALTAIVLSIFKSNLRNYLKYIFFSLLGIIFGLVWTFLTAYALGPWFGAFSIPVIVCWTGGGLTAMIFAAGNGETVKTFALKLIIGLIICAGFVYKYNSVLAFLLNDRTLTLAAVKQDDSGSYALNDGINALTAGERKIIDGLEIKGNLNVSLKTTFGSGDSTGLVIIMKSPLKKTVLLSEPDAGEIIYVQQSDTIFRYSPPGAKLSERKITLYPDAENSRTVNYWIDLAGGGRHGGTFLDWKFDK